MNILALPALFSLVAAAAPTEALPKAETALAALKTLVGDWEGVNAKGRTTKASFRLTAGDTVLVENWDMGGGRSSMTVYHLDGTDLMATHYCPLGNQPRLVLTQGAPGRLNFTFRDATNLSSPTAEHEHSFWLALDGKDAFLRNETYFGPQGPSTSEIAFKRAS